ncbi:MAG TPA: SO2930 family diheme c-type cytochrome, partial [Parvularculaceae bacterium]|nr:SO2930 family diheme c-type cytochrome [Parvularculaceae bacterium]
MKKGRHPGRNAARSAALQTRDRVRRNTIPHLRRIASALRRARDDGAKITLIVVALALAACSKPAPTPTYHAEGYPEHLSDWGVVTTHDGALELTKGVIPYDIATPLYSDYALKLRTVALPKGEKASYNASEAFDFPVGTIISKTFFYPQADETWDGKVTYGAEHTVENGVMPLKGYRLIETRILVHRKDGWVGIPYVWNEGQTDAVLKRAGEIVPMTMCRPDGREEKFNYLVPNANQCAGCHATNLKTREIHPIGPKARHLNKLSTFAAGKNQLDVWNEIGMLEGFPGADKAPSNVDWTDETAPLGARARAYLDANCSHCHSPTGPADTSGLDLRPMAAFGPSTGFCKSPIAAGAGTGGNSFDIKPGDPDHSILVYRMETDDPGAMMPELGRSLE